MTSLSTSRCSKRCGLICGASEQLEFETHPEPGQHEEREDPAAGTAGMTARALPLRGRFCVSLGVNQTLYSWWVAVAQPDAVGAFLESENRSPKRPDAGHAGFCATLWTPAAGSGPRNSKGAFQGTEKGTDVCTRG